MSANEMVKYESSSSSSDNEMNVDEYLGNEREISWQELNKMNIDGIDNERPFQCLICEMKFKRKFRLKQHEKSHNHKCALCDMVFLSYPSYVSHNSSVHNICAFTQSVRTVKIEPLVCPECPDKVFTKKRALYSHKSVVHGEKRLQCSLCPKMFAFKSQLDRHEKHHKHECNLCDAFFENYNKLEKHRKEIHCVKKKSLKTYYCDMCKLSFENYNTLFDHNEKEHSEVEYECDICKRSYKYKRNLKDHIKRVHGGVTFACTFESCTVECPTKRTLNTHMKSHKTVTRKTHDEYLSDTSIIDLMNTNKEWKMKPDIS